MLERGVAVVAVGNVHSAYTSFPLPCIPNEQRLNENKQDRQSVSYHILKTRMYLKVVALNAAGERLHIRKRNICDKLRSN